MSIRDLLDGLGGTSVGPTVLLAGADTAVGDRVSEAAGDEFELVTVDVADIGPRAREDDVAAVVACHDPPGFDGTLVAEELADAPVLVVAHDPDAGPAALAAGADDFAALSAGPDLLVERLSRVVAGGLDLPDTEAAASAVGAEAGTIEALNEATRRLLAADTMDDVARVAAEAASDVLDFPGTSVRQYNSDTHELDPVATSATGEDIDRPSYPVADSPHGRAWERGETVVDDVGDDDPYDREVFSQTMYVPIGEFGTLSVGVEDGEFSDLNRLYAEILARNARLAFEQAQQDRRLAEALVRVSDFADRVARASSEVTGASQEVRAASREVTEAVEEISSGADEQSEDLQRVLDEMDNLLATVEETAATADAVADQSQETAELAEEGGNRADRGMQEMGRIEDRTAAMVEDIRELNDEMARVSEIVDLIDDVAEQTNILALNASIEAARAGEAGEGFAVVADEVKTLAEETRQSTEEIADIIGSVRERTDDTVAEMEALQTSVSDSVETVADALDALERIGDQVGETDESVQQISDAISDQANSVQQTVATAERVASISEEVSGQTTAVEDLVREQATALEQVSGNAEELETMATELQSLTEELSVNEAVAAQVEAQQTYGQGGAASDD
jgi:methyl-accepting chemotaxis protein